jgi:FkbM family methyltransferase
LRAVGYEPNEVVSRTSRTNDSPELTRELVSRRVFADDPLFVVDVGASRGIDRYWAAFGDQLRAVGFDPLVAEVDRLNAAARPGVRYEAAWVTRRDPAASTTDRSTQFFQRTSAVRAAEVSSLDYIRQHFNAGAPIERTDTRIVLDDYFARDERDSVDFLKVDTDGGDFDVLRGAEEMLRDGGILGLAVEAQFHGLVDRESNLLSNVDLYLRDLGFGLFDLEVYRYSRSALPSEFALELPAQTVTGQVSWGEAFYFRDLGDPRYESMWGFRPTAVDLFKLMCLFEIFGMPDCAAELILEHGQLLGDERTGTELLDILAAQQVGAETTYADLLHGFDADARRRFSPGTPSGGVPQRGATSLGRRIRAGWRRARRRLR